MPTEYVGSGKNPRYRTSMHDFVDPTVESHMSDEGLVIDGIYKVDALVPKSKDGARNIDSIRVPGPEGWSLPQRQQTE